MTELEFWTEVAIWTLIVGSLAVFVWFARDLLRLARATRQPERPAPSPGDAP